MRVETTISAIADFLWDVLTDDKSASKFHQDPQTALAEAGHHNVSSQDLDAAIERISSRLPTDSLDRVEPLKQASCTLPSAHAADPAQVLSHSVGVAPAVAHAAPAPQPQVVTKVVHDTQVVHDTKVVHDTQVIREQPVIHQQVTNQTTQNNVTNHVVNEGATHIDNRTITEINARGDVTFDQKVQNNTTVADHGGVAVHGDVHDSAVNTGTNTGVIAGDDANLDHSVVGDHNTQLNDSTVGAIAQGGGNATNIEGHNVNTGSGNLNDVDTDGGDAQVVNGNGNHTTGDVSVDASDSKGPVNVAVGDHNSQSGKSDNSTTIDDSGNTDNSVEDSANTTVKDSANTSEQHTDLAETKIEDSGNTTQQDNDTTKVDASLHAEDNSTQLDNDHSTLAIAADAPEAGQHDLTQLEPATTDAALTAFPADDGLDDGLGGGLGHDAGAFDLQHSPLDGGFGADDDLGGGLHDGTDALGSSHDVGMDFDDGI